VPAADRAWVKEYGDGAGAWLQSLTGVTMEPFVVVAYADPHALAVVYVQRTGGTPADIPAQEALFRGGNLAAIAQFHSAFLNLFQAADWNVPASERQKIVAHEGFHLVQEQLLHSPEGASQTQSPTWLTEGSAEAMGYRVAAARGLTDLAGVRSAVAARVRGTTVTLTSLETFAGVSQAHAWDTLHLAADHLATIAPKGALSFVDFYAVVGAGTEWHTAFQAAFGMTLAQYYANFDAYRASL